MNGLTLSQPTPAALTRPALSPTSSPTPTPMRTAVAGLPSAFAAIDMAVVTETSAVIEPTDRSKPPARSTANCASVAMIT